MTPLTFATWIVVVLVTAWGANAVMKYGGHGLTADVLLGLAGGGSACGIAFGLGMFPQPGIAATAVVACVGAGVLIALQRRFLYVPLGKRHPQGGRR
jgi:uncharacterized membrane protein YeaQ/YmgE (transglycosylase-associated protein family)